MVKNIPGYVKARTTMLPLSQKYANLPEEVKEKTVHAESKYSFGWSHGKEVFNGKPDTAKGSYYANPQYDTPFSDEELIKEFPENCLPNIWPKEDLPELEPAFKNLGQLIVSVGEMVAAQADKYVKSVVPTYADDTLSKIIRESKTCKARLLHYFPADGKLALGEDQDSWCGWHLDHGALTGLTRAMFLDKDGKEVPPPDPTAGLYIKNRGGKTLKVSIPEDCLAFQIGESAQVLSGGTLRATWHCVQAAGGSTAEGVGRNTYACFMQPDLKRGMAPPPATASTPEAIGIEAWREGQDFAAFTKATLAKYYK